MMDKKIEELKKLAMAATPGEWEVFSTDKQVCVLPVIADGDDPAEPQKLNDGFDIAHTYGPGEKENADLIAAANPAAIIDLIAHIESLTEELALTRAEVGTLRDESDADDVRDMAQARRLITQLRGELAGRSAPAPAIQHATSDDTEGGAV